MNPSHSSSHNKSTSQFISIEGQDGAGKTTNLEFICQQLTKNKIPYIVTREPGGTPLGESIRDILLNRNELEITPISELLLMFAARAQHLENVIEPALRKGVWVVCDRFTDASFAYQGGGHGIHASTIQTFADIVQKNRVPNLTIMLDVDIQTGESRVNTRNQEKDRYEQQQSDFKTRVRDTYLSLAKAEPERIKLIDASNSIENVTAQISTILSEFIKIKTKT
ncbi:MAG: dTMP kinase [Arenicella sp.]